MRKRVRIPSLLLFSIALAWPLAAQNALPAGGSQYSAAGAQNGRDSQLEVARQYMSQGRYYEASKIAAELLAANPEDSDAQALKRDSSAALKEYEEKKLLQAEATARASGATDADRLALADAYFEAGRYLSASDLYARLPQSLMSSEVQLRRARALAWGGRSYEAEQVYSGLLATEHDPSLELEYGRMLSWMGAFRLSIEKLSAYYAAHPTEEAVIALADAKAWSGDRAGATALLESFITSHPDAPAATKLRDDISRSPELRLERVDRMIEQAPFNLALQMERARLLIDAGRFAEALKTIDFIEQHKSGTVEGLSELKASARQKRQESQAALRLRLQNVKDSGDPDQLLQLARAYSTIEDYPRAIDLYERYLKLRPEDTEVRIQYARVLGWDRRYHAAEKQFEQILAKNPDRADLRLEYAQILSYDEQYVAAVRTFTSLTDLSGNPRAHLYPDVPQKAYFNLGQVYRWYGWNEHAVFEQNQALALDPSFAPARAELDLTRHLRPASVFEGKYSFAEDSSRFRLKRFDLDGEKWTSQRTALDVTVGRHQFQIPGDSVNATVFGLGGRYRWQDRWTAIGKVGANFYDSGLGTRLFWNLGAEWLPNIQSRAAFEYDHYDLVYDVFTVASLRQSPLRVNDFKGHYDYKSGGFWSWLADASYGLISDDNKRLSGHGLLTFRVMKSPFVAVKGDVRYLSYDFRSNRYWSPDRYHSVAGVLQIGDNFRNRVFWDVEGKYGRAYEDSHKSDIRSYEGRVTVPVNDSFDLIGAYGDGKSGRIDSVFGNESFVNYWQRHWYVGVRLKRLFRNEEKHARPSDYYFDDRQLEQSPELPPLGVRR